ncbi:MAG TPA: aminotransferase class V-fold PLP-dependent enzyme [Chromatiaceae bacterium]|nr:aminotransferase class V-fold PLP-dependent enzyme [Chromatiaceae bacterium]
MMPLSINRISWITVINAPGEQARHAGNVNVQFVGFSAHDVLNVLQPYLAASTGSACSSGIPEPSHVLKAIGLSSDEAESSVRFSLGFGTSNKDIEDAVGLSEEGLTKLSMSALTGR